MNINYLQSLDAQLKIGFSDLSESFVQPHYGFILSCRQPNGGFRGRLGSSDFYYTDFALRSLSLYNQSDWNPQTAADFCKSSNGLPSTIIECFNVLNIIRLLDAYNVNVPIPDSVFDLLDTSQNTEGGFASDRTDQTSAYNTFLGLLCFELVGKDITNPQQIANALQSLTGSTGGFSETGGQSTPQTNATAAVLGSLIILQKVDLQIIQAATDFLISMQDSSGGFLAHPLAQCPDLLSTFTALTTLWFLNRLDKINLASAAGFIKKMVLPDGGFISCIADQQPDIEYTYYGLASIALLRAYVTNLKRDIKK